MSRAGRLALIVAAWVGPLVWLALWTSMSTSDGTVVTRPGAVLGEGRWDDSLVVLETYGGTPLQDGDEILQIEGAGISEMVSGADASSAGRGDVLRYQVRRQVGELYVNQQVEVPLPGTPWATPCSRTLRSRSRPSRFWSPAPSSCSGTPPGRGRGHPAGRRLRGGGAHRAAVRCAGPGGRRRRRALAARRRRAGGGSGPRRGARRRVGLPPAPGGCRRPAELATRRRTVRRVGLLAGRLRRSQPAPAQLQAQLDVTRAAVVTVALLGALALATGGRRADSVDQRVAHRLLVSALLTAAVVLLVLDVVPIALRGSPLVAREVLALVLVPVVLACWVAAVLGYRLVEIDATLRRSLVQRCSLHWWERCSWPQPTPSTWLPGRRSARWSPGEWSRWSCCRRCCCCAVPRAARVRRPRLPLPRGVRAAAAGADDRAGERRWRRCWPC